MLTALFSALTSRLAGPLATACALVLALLLGVQTVKLARVTDQLADARGTINALRLDAATCRANTATLESAIKSSNAAVAALKAETDRRATMLSEALVTARREAQEAGKRASALEQYQATGKTVCERVLSVDAKVLEGRR